VRSINRSISDGSGALRLGLRPQPRSFGCGCAALCSLAAKNLSNLNDGETEAEIQPKRMKENERDPAVMAATSFRLLLFLAAKLLTALSIIATKLRLRFIFCRL